MVSVTCFYFQKTNLSKMSGSLSVVSFEGELNAIVQEVITKLIDQLLKDNV